MTILTRRDALRSLALAPTITLPRNIRIVMVGVQGHPNEILGPAESHANMEVAGLYESDPRELNGIRRRPKAGAAKVFSDWRKMLDEAKPDVVGICTPGGAPRVEAILETTRRGLPWIAEKPLANDVEGMQKVKAALKAKPVPFSALFPMRFDPPYRALRRIVQEGLIGEVAQIDAQKSYKAGSRPEWMRNMATYGGTIPWIGCHMVDLMRFTSGREMTSVFSYQAQVGHFPGIGQMQNTTGSVFRLDNQGVGVLHMDYYRPESAPTHGDDRLRLAGTKGVAEYMAATGVTLLAEGRKLEVVKDLPAQGSVFLDFLDAVYNGKPQTLTQADVLRVCDIVAIAEQAARQGRPASLV